MSTLWYIGGQYSLAIDSTAFFGGVPLWCVKRRWVVSWPVVGCRGVVADHGVQGQDAAVGQGEDGLVMAFALVAFALVVGPGDGVRVQ